MTSFYEKPDSLLKNEKLWLNQKDFQRLYGKDAAKKYLTSILTQIVNQTLFFKHEHLQAVLDDEGDDKEELVEAVSAAEQDLARTPLKGVHLFHYCYCD